ncbi:MAG: HAD family hydrolase [Clostridia bacterium]|nr:HAD family hydrolase [Clostridia bacterium]
MKIKGIIFDKDGTLFKFKDFWIPIAEKAAEFVIETLNAPECLKEEMLNEIGINEGINGVICYGTYDQIANGFARVLKKHRIDCGDISDITMEGFHRYFNFGKIVPPCTNLENLFSRFKEKRLKIFLATTDDMFLTRKCLKKLGILEYFDDIYTDDGIHKCKPDPYYINLIVHNYNVKQDELVMVGDTMTDINFAHNGNIKAIGVASNEADKNTLKTDAEVVIDNISQLAEVLDEI